MKRIATKTKRIPRAVSTSPPATLPMVATAPTMSSATGAVAASTGLGADNVGGELEELACPVTEFKPSSMSPLGADGEIDEPRQGEPGEPSPAALLGLGVGRVDAGHEESAP
jgi:hypothetical protein